jgi:hypothetical protein
MRCGEVRQIMIMRPNIDYVGSSIERVDVRQKRLISEKSHIFRMIGDLPVIEILDFVFPANFAPPFFGIAIDKCAIDQVGRVYFYMPEILVWPAPGSADTELGVLMGPEVCHGETEVYTRVQA